MKLRIKIEREKEVNDPRYAWEDVYEQIINEDQININTLVRFINGESLIFKTDDHP